MKFNTISILKHEMDHVWTMMRDDLPKLVDLMDDIESIRVESYEQTGRMCRVVNIWRASPGIPRSIASRLDSNMFIWTDFAEWNEDKKECNWRIEHHHFRDKIHCAGTTKFASAMGGRGTRITFRGDFKMNTQNLPKFLGVLEEPVLITVETILKSLIPKNFHKLTSAIAQHLDSNRDQEA